MNDEELSKKVERLDDIEAIKQLKARYAMALDGYYRQTDGRPRDEGRFAEKIDGIFTEDAVWDGSSFGLFKGRQAICDHFRQAALACSAAVHYFVLPEFVLGDGKARARWYVWVVLTQKSNGIHKIISAFENDEYVKIGGQWLANHMKAEINFITALPAG